MIRTKPPSDEYRDGWDRVFGEPRERKPVREVCDWHRNEGYDRDPDCPGCARRLQQALER